MSAQQSLPLGQLALFGRHVKDGAPVELHHEGAYCSRHGLTTHWRHAYRCCGHHEDWLCRGCYYPATEACCPSCGASVTPYGSGDLVDELVHEAAELGVCVCGAYGDEPPSWAPRCPQHDEVAP